MTVGRKAAVLFELAGAGFPVPEGFVVPAGAPLDDLPDRLAALGGGPVAVRSSGVDEDTADRSYAGQYTTILNVTGPAAVAAAVEECRASAADAVAYHGGTPGELAVLVQRMVPADAAGVAFTVNPVTGAAETVISAVTGLGDRLVSGAADAAEWTVRDGAAAGSGVISAGTALRVAELAGKVAAHFGVAQDIEWAVAGGELWLLQARPVTAAVPQVPVEVVVPAGFATRNRTVDRPWTPLERSVFQPVFGAAAEHIFAFTTGVRPTAVDIGGWSYVVVTEAPGAATFARAGARLAAGEPLALVRQWNSTWRAELVSRMAALRTVPLDALSDDALAVHAGAVRTLFEDLHDRYFRLTGAAIALLGSLGALLEDELGWDAPATLRLRPGLRGIHMPAAEDLGRVAPAEWIAAHGHRTAGFDLTTPTLAERPEIVRAMAANQAGYDFVAERAASDARVAAAATSARAALADPAPFEAAFAANIESAAVRDEKSYLAVGAWALVRYAALEAGRRLVAAGVLDRVDDVLFLEWDEVFSGSVSSGGAAAGTVRRRRGEHAWALAHPGPPSYGTPPAPGGGPESPEARRAARIGQWSMSVMGGAAPPSTGDGVLAGVAASAGRRTGPCRIVTGVADFDRVRPGDILVCPETTAQWAVLFPTIGALVTDRGSLLSHPAILAREYGVPAVVATGSATSTLHDGDIVEVDGTAGTARRVA